MLWKKAIDKALWINIDYVFASEDYGFKLAEILDAQYVPVDHARELVPVSGTQIRENPMTNWDYIPECVRSYYAKRVCIFGPESTGKSTLAKNLAVQYNTVYACEYARGLLNFKDGVCDYEDIEKIARGHRASEEALIRNANKVMFSDTDMLTTTIWSEKLFKKCPQWVTETAETRKYDLYLVMDVDVLWVDDSQRFLKEQPVRQDFMDRCINALEKRGKNYLVIGGGWKERFKKSCEVINNLLREK